MNGPAAQEQDHLVAIWLQGSTPSEADALVRETLTRVGMTPRCEVCPSVVEDQIVDVIVTVKSRAQAGDLQAAIRRACDAPAGVSLVRSFIFPRA